MPTLKETQLARSCVLQGGCTEVADSLTLLSCESPGSYPPQGAELVQRQPCGKRTVRSPGGTKVLRNESGTPPNSWASSCSTSSLVRVV